MTDRRSPRLFDAALAILGVSMVQLVDILLITRGSPAEGLDPCSLDVFGLRFPGNGDGCYMPVGIPVALALATLALAALVYWGPRWLAPIAGLAAGVLALALGAALLPQDGLVTTASIQVGLLGASAFLVHIPTGPRRRPAASRAWRIALIACGVLFGLDTAFSGFMRTSAAGPQGAFVVVGVLLLVAGLWSGRLAAREPDEAHISAPAEAPAA
jgi:hypothetical protein